MITIGLGEARKRLGALIDRVAGGQSVLLLRRGKPVARIVSVRRSDDAVEALVRRGWLRPAARPDDDPFLDEPLDVGSDVGVVDAVLEERREGR